MVGKALVRFSPRAIFVLMFSAAMFFGGYRMGYDDGEEQACDFDQLLKLIEETVFEREGRDLFSYAHPIFWAPFTLVGEGI